MFYDDNVQLIGTISLNIHFKKDDVKILMLTQNNQTTTCVLDIDSTPTFSILPTKTDNRRKFPPKRTAEHKKRTPLRPSSAEGGLGGFKKIHR